MFFGDEKLRQMARSILPSTASKTARQRRASINRQSRRLSRRLCHQAALDVESSEDFDFEDDLARHEIRSMVFERRGADKLGHFERWAIEVTDHMGDDPSSRRAKLRAILPDGLIGWHAAQHLDGYDEFRTQRINRYGNWKEIQAERAKLKAENRLTREKALTQLRSILADDVLLARLNSHIRSRHRRPVWRLGYTREVLPNIIGSQVIYGKKLLLVEKTVGVEEAPVLREGFLCSFVDQVFKADRRNWIAPPESEIRGLLFPASEVADPTCHPEWFVALDSFLKAWREGKLDGTEPWDTSYSYPSSYRPWWEKWSR